MRPGTTRYEGRSHAGEALAEAFGQGIAPDALLLGLPRGGVIVAAAMARVLRVQLGVYIVRKLRAPLNEEFAIGALAEDGPPYLERETVAALRVSRDYLLDEIDGRRTEIEHLRSLYRAGHALGPLTGHPVIVVDDGIATGATVSAALTGLRSLGPIALSTAAPVASPSACRQLRSLSDEILFLDTPDDFWAVGQYYRRFDQVTDEEVIAALGAPTRTP